MKKVFFLLTFQVSVSIFFATTSYGAIYKYVDKDGIVCFADDLQVIPDKYRATAIIVEGESKDEAVPIHEQAVKETGQLQPASDASANPTVSKSLSFRLMISGLVIAGFLLASIILGKQEDLRQNQRAQSIIRSSIIGILSIYLIAAHARDVMTLFGIAGRAVDHVQQKSAEKGKKAGQTIKQLDALFEQAQKAEEAAKNSSGEESTSPSPSR